MDCYSNLSDDSVLEALEPIGFKSVVEQLLNERKRGGFQMMTKKSEMAEWILDFLDEKKWMSAKLF